MMKTLTLNQQNMIRRVLLLLLLVAAFSITFVFAAKPAHAADDTYTLSGTYVTSEDTSMTDLDTLPSNSSSVLELYKVGTFSGPDLVFVEAYQAAATAVNINIKKEQYEQDGELDEDAWTAEWLKQAGTMLGYVKESGNDPNYTIQVDGDGKLTNTSVENGLYLLTGDGKLVKDYPTEGDLSYWSPKPMFVLIWNGDREIGVKPQAEGSAYKLRVNKIWAGDEDLKDLVRPDSVEVELHYDGYDPDNHDVWKTITLDNSNEWSYEWKTNKGMHDPTKWYAVEKLDGAIGESYVVSQDFTPKPLTPDEDGIYEKDKNGITKIITITNTFDRHKIKITKTLNSIIDHGVGLNNSLVFELTGVDAHDNQVYHKYVGLEYSTTDGPTKSIEVENIPRNVKTLTVKEIYSGNHETTSENPQTIVFGQNEEDNDSQSGTTVTVEDGDNDGQTTSETADSTEEEADATFAFVNELNNKTHISGIINKYKLNDAGNGFVYQNGSNQGESNE